MCEWRGTSDHPGFEGLGQKTQDGSRKMVLEVSETQARRFEDGGTGSLMPRWLGHKNPFTQREADRCTVYARIIRGVGTWLSG